MTKYAAEDFNANSSDSRTASSSLSESVNSNMTLEDVKAILTKKIPADVCIRDQDGYIACGPIVGSPRPEKPGSGIFILPEKPIEPPTGKFPPPYEIPNLPGEPKNPIQKWPTEPLIQIKPWPGKTYELPLDNSK